jgi:4-hydroxyphenylacetate 3-monooxygenase
VLAIDVERSDGTSERIEFPEPFLLICGYTGRDAEEVARHIAELGTMGVAPPESIPIFVPLPGSLVQLADGAAAEVESRATSGEPEPVFIRIPGRGDFLAVGSDHTDRALETESIEAGKGACPKFISTTAWPLEDVEDRWDRMQLSAAVNGSAQSVVDGPLSALTPPKELLPKASETLALPDDVPLVLFMGTLAGAHTDPDLKRVHRFTALLADPDTGRSLACAYDIEEPAEEAVG